VCLDSSMYSFIYNVYVLIGVKVLVFLASATVYMYTQHIHTHTLVCLVIQTKNKLRSTFGLSKCSLYTGLVLNHTKITVECKLWCQNSYHMYVVIRH